MNPPTPFPRQEIKLRGKNQGKGRLASSVDDEADAAVSLRESRVY